MIAQITPTTFQRGRMLLTNHNFVGFYRELIIIQGARASFRGESGRVQGQDRIHAWSEEEVLILQNHGKL